MPQTVEERIQKLLDRLDNPNLTSREIEKIQEKIEVLKSHSE